jgi:hypothetical protein
MATCANEAAGASTKASITASAIFFTVVHLMEGFSVSGILRAFQLVEGSNA